MRFSYTGNVFINNSSLQGRMKESTQMGAELIGDDSIDADAEMIALAIHLLLAAGLWWYRPRRAEPVPGRVYESERMPENNAVLNPEPEVAEKQSGYCLTAEDGMLLIFDGTSGEVCFQTHMPLSEFSVEEQEKLLEGVWFDTMTDVFHYLESFSS